MINLLPPKEKQILLKQKQFQIVLILGILFLVCLFCFSSILFFIKTDIQQKLLSQQKALEKKGQEFNVLEINDLENDITAFNQVFSKLDSFYGQEFYLTDIFYTLSKTMPTGRQVMPSGFYLTNFSYGQEEKNISLSGFCPDRDALSEFKTNLEKQEIFKEISFPASNWVKPIDIDFFVSFKVARERSDLEEQKVGP